LSPAEPIPSLNGETALHLRDDGLFSLQIRRLTRAVDLWTFSFESGTEVKCSRAAAENNLRIVSALVFYLQRSSAFGRLNAPYYHPPGNPKDIFRGA
jgi:hypothetical protein